MDIRQLRPPVQTPFEDDRYYTVKEIAETMRASQSTVTKWVRRFGLIAQPLPKGIRILGREMNRFLQRLANSNRGVS